MTTPASGPISLQDIQDEFDGTNPIGLNEYYAGAGLVPAGTSGPQAGTYGPVSSSGSISLGMFYGTNAAPPPPFIAYRANTLTDTSTRYRFFILDTSSGNAGIAESGTDGGLIWVQAASLVSSSQLAAGVTAAVYVDNQTRGTGSISVSQPTVANPFVDVVINDDAPPDRVIIQFRIELQVAIGGVNPPIYIGALLNDGVHGVPVDQNQMTDDNPCYPPEVTPEQVNPGYPNIAGHYLPRFYNGAQSVPGLVNYGYSEPKPDFSIICPPEGG